MEPTGIQFESVIQIIIILATCAALLSLPYVALMPIDSYHI